MGKELNHKTRTVGNGEGSFYYSEAEGKWIYQYYYKGKKKVTRQKKNENKTQFKVRVTEIKNDINKGTYIEKSKDTFISILENHVEQKHNDGTTSNISYARELLTIQQLKKVGKDFVDKPIQEIEVEDIQKAKPAMREYSDEVIQKQWGLIKKTFKIAFSRRKIPFNIMEDEELTKPFSKKEKKKVEALSIDEENKLIDLLNKQESQHKYRNAVLLQLYTGMRIGEVLALSKDCIDLENNTITVYRTLTRDVDYSTLLGEHTKTFDRKTNLDKGKRTFPMSENMKAIIMNILNSKITNIQNMLFWDYQNDTFISPREINSWLRRLNEKYNICPNASLHTHRLRHTFITRCVEAGLSLYAIQGFVGHVPNSDITNRYVSTSIDFMSKELNKKEG